MLGGSQGRAKASAYRNALRPPPTTLVPHQPCTMTMIANAPPIIVTDPPSKPPITGVLDAGSFWPHIDLAKLRDSVDVDGSVTAARLTHAAANALASVIKDLSNWAAAQAAAGFDALSSVPAIAINGTSVNVLCFERAVYAYAKADLIERYAGADATGRTEPGDERRELQASDYRADALRAVRDILGVARMESELI